MILIPELEPIPESLLFLLELELESTKLVKHQTIEAVSSLSFPQFLTGANNYIP